MVSLPDASYGGTSCQSAICSRQCNTKMTTYVISASLADVRSHPDPTSELVTQALMNTPAKAGENRGEWIFVTLSDYEGWVRNHELEEPIVKGFCKVGTCCGTPLPFVAVIS